MTPRLISHYINDISWRAPFTINRYTLLLHSLPKTTRSFSNRLNHVFCFDQTSVRRPTVTKTSVLKLLDASSRGNLRRFKKLAKELAEEEGKGIAETVANAKNKIGLSSLHMAAASGILSNVKYLIDGLKLDVDDKDGKGLTAFFHASSLGYLSTAVYLLEKGANPTTRSYLGFTPLHTAASEGKKDLVNFLLSRNVDVDAISGHGTPLQKAAAEGRHEIVKILLDHHANPNLYCEQPISTLSAAVIEKSLPSVKLLIEAGADLNVGTCGVVPLVVAATQGETEMIKCLLKAGADPNVYNHEGLTPLEIAVINENHQDVQILYPVTSPIPTYSDWSIGGISRHVESEEVTEKRKAKAKESFNEAKSQGETAFQKKEYLLATKWYSMATTLDPSDATVYSNRSLCYALLKEGEAALADAKACINLKPEWPKGYYRAGAAWNVLKEFDQAAAAFSKALELDRGNRELQNAFQEAEAKVRSINI